MKLVLVGVQDMNFTTQDNSQIDGVKLHYLAIDGSIFGHKATSKFVQRNVLNACSVGVKELTDVIGSEIDVDFNETGKICGIQIMSTGKKKESA
jgi:hypothetical protein